MYSQSTEFITHSQRDNKTSNKETSGEQLQAPVVRWAAQRGYVEMRMGEVPQNTHQRMLKLLPQPFADIRILIVLRMKTLVS